MCSSATNIKANQLFTIKRFYSAKDANTKESTSDGTKSSTNIQVKSKSGILSVTTTIEDSKLNEVVFEKMSPTGSSKNQVDNQNKSPHKPKVDFNKSSLERNFVTPARAMSDFLLKASDLESLAKIKRRSPYEQEPPITVFWRKDVEARAIEVWGSRENLLRECLKREIERKKHQQSKFAL